MKSAVPIIVSFACFAVQALPIPDDRGTNGAAVNDLSGEANNLSGPIGNDVSKLLGPLANHVGARFKRVLLDDIKDNISLQLNGNVKRSPNEENEEAADCSEGEEIPDISESGQNTLVEIAGDTVNNAGNAVSYDSDNSSLIDDSSLTANDIENGVSAEAGDQTDLSKRTIAASVDGFITGIGNTVVTTGVTVDGSIGRIEGIAVA